MERKRLRNVRRLIAAMSVGGVCLQIDTCGTAQFLAGFNPCGSLLNCDPRLYAFVQSDAGQPGGNYNVDPFCTFPPFCTTAQDPIFGGLGGP